MAAAPEQAGAAAVEDEHSVLDVAEGSDGIHIFGDAVLQALRRVAGLRPKQHVCQRTIAVVQHCDWAGGIV